MKTFMVCKLIVACLLLIGTSVAQYSDHGVVKLTGTLTGIDNQQTCAEYNCFVGAQWTATLSFTALNWNAADSNFSIDTVLINCIAGPPCFTGYTATSDFGWGPYGFDTLHIEVKNGRVSDVSIATGGYAINWGQTNNWMLINGFNGTTTGAAYAIQSRLNSSITH